MSTEWSISFKVRINKETKTDTSIMRFTNRRNVPSYVIDGTRIPLVHLWPKANTIHISMNLGDAITHPHDIENINFDQYYHIEIHQRYISNGEYRYYIVLDGVEVHSAINKKAKQYHNVYIYAAGNTHNAADGYIKEFQFTNFL